MPFTLAHPAAILPLRALPLPTTAMAVGAMSPDLPLFVPTPGGYLTSHSLVGIVSTDVVVTLVLLALWAWVARDVLVDLSPAPVRERLEPHARLSRRQWALAVPAAALGAATHVGWDLFTHAGRWGPKHIGWLRTEHLGLEGHRWAQYGGGVVGLLALAAATYAWLRGRPRAVPPRARLLPSWTLAVTLAGTGATGLAVLAWRWPDGARGAGYDAVVSTVQLGVVATTVVCAVWHLRRTWRAAPVRSDQPV